MNGSGNGSDPFRAPRQTMVRRQLRERGIGDERVLEAMEAIPRHMFVPPELAEQAYADHPLPIGCGATLSQPFIVAFMTQALAPRAGDRVLEIGSGSGYQTAILARLAARVYAVEIHPELVAAAQSRLEALGLAGKVEMRAGNGRDGWPEQAPFDGILIAACMEQPPTQLTPQLTEGGHMIYPQAMKPNADEDQNLWLARRVAGRLETRWMGYCRFVPLV